MNKPNFVLHKPAQISLNGTQDRAASKSRHQSPEAIGQHNSQAAAAAAPPPIPPPSLLGPWEPSIQGNKPNEDMCKTLADFLYFQVVNHPEAGSIKAYGAQFEIEAKLGIIKINSRERERISFGIATEAILEDNGSMAFESSMNEVS